MSWTLFFQIVLLMGWGTLCLAGLQPSNPKPKKPKGEVI